MPRNVVTTPVGAGSNWTKPANWNGLDNMVECLGGGANGGAGTGGGGGGAGGNYAVGYNCNPNPQGGTIPIYVSGNTTGTTGYSTTFGQSNGNSTTTPGHVGAISGFMGGNLGQPGTNNGYFFPAGFRAGNGGGGGAGAGVGTAGGGGGAAGPHGPGENGGTGVVGTPGFGGAGDGGVTPRPASGAGIAGTQWGTQGCGSGAAASAANGSAGGMYGAGGSGGSQSGGVGRQGLIVITWSLPNSKFATIIA